MRPKLIPQWRKCWRRYSTWLLTAMGAISLNDIVGFMPSIQQYMDPEIYRFSMIGLSVATLIAINIKQNSVSGDK